RRQRQPATRRAESHRQDLAARLGRGCDRCDDQQRQGQRDACSRAAPGARADPRAGGLRMEQVQRSGSRQEGAMTGAATEPAALARSAVADMGEADDDAATAVISLYARSKKIYPRAVHGWFAGWRWALVWATQLVFYGLPWLQWNGRQALLFDLTERR